MQLVTGDYSQRIISTQFNRIFRTVNRILVVPFYLSVFDSFFPHTIQSYLITIYILYLTLFFHYNIFYCNLLNSILFYFILFYFIATFS